MYRAHLLDLWLFIRKVAPNGAAILLILLLSAAVFYGADAWPEASFLDCFINAVYMMTVESVQIRRSRGDSAGLGFELRLDAYYLASATETGQ